MSLAQIGDVLRGNVVGEGSPTPFDLPNIGDLSDSEIEQYVRSKVRDDLDSPETFIKFNRIYKKVLIYLEEELFYTKNELNRFKRRKEFSSIEDIVSFLKETTTKRGKMNCVIVKVFQSFYDSDAEFNHRVHEVRDKTQGVIDNKLIKPLRILQSNEDELSGEEYFEFSEGQVRKIPYKIKKRLKSTHSTVSKEIRDPKYFSIEQTSDMHGLTFEVENKDDILPLMQMIAGYVFKRGDYNISNDKGMFSLDEIESNNELNDDFKNRLISGTAKRDKPESGDVVDIKLVTPKAKGKGSENMNIEIKFTLVKNRNENGLNMHGVYNYAKKLKERIRLEGFISHDYIELIVDKFLGNLGNILATNIGRSEQVSEDTYPYLRELFNDLKLRNFIDSSIDLRNKHHKANISQYLRQGLIQYYKSALTPIRINNSKKPYFSNKRAIEMFNNGLLPGVQFGEILD